MKNINIKRKLSFIDDKSPKYFMMNQKNMGQIYPATDNKFSTEDSIVEIYVKDNLGIKSNKLKIRDDGEVQIEYRLNKAWLISTIIMLIATFTFITMINFPSIRAFVREYKIIIAGIPIAWIFYLGYTYLFLKDKLYILRRTDHSLQ